MGEHNLNTKTDSKARRDFIYHLLEDVQTLELMLKNGKIEKGITRIGAEQEFCLVNENWRPSTLSTSILKSINDSHFTTELAKFNLEINLDPFELTTDAFSKLETQLRELLGKAQIEASKHKNRVILSGILPSISTHEVGMDFMTDNPRYFALNDMLKKLRTTDFRMHLSGVDELSVKHDSVMYEACNTSFQMHLQIDPDDFICSYNWAQAISGPVLSVCVNSPLLFGKELWQETRIALFQQSIDTRAVSYTPKDQQARVTFGDAWASGSIVDFYKNEISRHQIILSKDIEESSMAEFRVGHTPKLQALNLHNGTIYKWNRPCYGVGGGKAHLRIENRYIPAGPTVLDEMANFAFWVGLMTGRPSKFDNIHTHMDFKNVKSNFIKAARYGTETKMHWMDEVLSVQDLILNKLLPIAQNGLEKMNINQRDIQRLLGVIEQRTRNHSPAQWMIKSFRNLKSELKHDDALIALTQSIHDYQQTNEPIHDWKILKSKTNANSAADQVGHIMTTQLFTALEEDTAALTLQIMHWKNIHHVPVVDQEGQLAGLLTWTHIQRFHDEKRTDHHAISVSQIMEKSVTTVLASTPISEAIALMKEHEFGCLPVLQKKQLVGIITIKDLLKFDHD